MKPAKKYQNALLSLTAIVALWLAWIVAYYIVRNEYVLPSFWDAFAEMGRILTDASFWRAFWNTFLRTLWAFLASRALGIVMAVCGHVV